MITLAWYLLKVIICSGILCGYYFFALRNKAFHRWNRFYLLAAVIISLIAPAIKINIFQNNKEDGTVVQMLQTISYGDEAVIEYSKNRGFQINTENLTEASYLLVSVIFLLIFFISLNKIKKMKKKYPETKIEDISFISTDEKGTPFSFFKTIFWNNAIDLHSKSGQQIFNHEIAHVKEKHSYDKIFMNLVLIFFWINPIFWLMRKELYMIHEFVADKEALEDSDINAFAEMILQTVYPGQNFSIGNRFFYSPLKRRIMMLTKNKNPKVSYYSRLLVLPLAAIVFFAFTLKVNSPQSNAYDGKVITVVIDAGHGGADNGAHSASGLKEKDITLSIAKKVAALNSNGHINILLSRDNDQSIPVRDRVHFAKDHHADLFVSIHVNGAADEQLNGFSVIVRRNNIEKNRLLASALINELKTSYKTEDEIAIRNKGLVVVDSNSCPAAVIECGYMTNPDDVAFVSKDANQEKIAKDILAAINNYASSKENQDSKSSAFIDDAESPVIKNSIPSQNHYKRIKGFTSNDSKNEVYVEYADGSKETITEEEALKKGIVLPPPQNALIIIDGKKSSKDRMKNIPSGNIESIKILKGQNAVKKYSEKAKDDVIEISTKEVLSSPPKDTMPDKVFTKVENEAQFPGGLQAWTKYISKSIIDSIGRFTDRDYGTCVIRFIVNVDGKVSDVIATTMKGTELAKVSIYAIKHGPKWIPASQNGKPIAAYRLQPVTLSNPQGKPAVKTELTKKSTIINTADDNQKIFIKLEQTASFPGGQSGWLKYISRVMQKNGNELIADKNSEGTCKVRFIVDREGKVRDVKAITKQGSKLADVAVNAIKNGPNWIPGRQNGHVVNSYLIQPVNFSLNDKMIKNEPL